MSVCYKAHPLLILRFLRPFLVVLILPFIKGAVQYLILGRATGVLVWEIALLSVIITLSILQYKAFSVMVDSEKVTVRKGFLIKSCSKLPKRNISAVTFERGPLDLIFRSTTCRINTESGNKNKDDFVFRLRKRQAAELESQLYVCESYQDIRFSYFKVALTSAATSSATRGILIAVPVINYANRLLGVAVNELLFDEINAASNHFNTYFPPAVNVITLVFLFFYGISFLNSLLRFMRFKLQLGKNTVKIESGVVVRRTAVFRKGSINNICVEQGPIMRFFDRCVMRASLAGYASVKGGRAIIVPSSSHAHIKKDMRQHFSLLDIKTPPLRAARGSRSLWRFLFAPRLVALIIVAAASFVMIFAPDFTKFALFITIVALAVTGYYGNLCYLDYRLGAISFGDNIFAESSYKLTRRELFCRKEQVGLIKISQTPFDRRYRTCKTKIVVRSESAEGVRVKNIDLEAIKEKIWGAYGIKL